MKELPKQLEAPKKKGIRIRFGHFSHEFGYTMKEIFIGKRTAFSILGFIVGCLLIGRSVWEYSVNYFGLPVTILVGFVVFILSGLSLHEFHDLKKGEEDHHHNDLMV